MVVANVCRNICVCGYAGMDRCMYINAKAHILLIGLPLARKHPFYRIAGRRNA